MFSLLFTFLAATLLLAILVHQAARFNQLSKQLNQTQAQLSQVLARLEAIKDTTLDSSEWVTVKPHATD